MNIITVDAAKYLVQQGDIIAYPTEAVFGLGCDPFNQAAVRQLLSLKNREPGKGLILLIAHWAQLSALIAPVPEKKLVAVKKSWPGFVTWIFPKNNALPDWLTGNHASIAIRMSAHQTARQLCHNHPIVSTSANISGYPPARTHQDLMAQFPEGGIKAVAEGALGGADKPSAIFDVLTGRQLR